MKTACGASGGLPPARERQTPSTLEVDVHIKREVVHSASVSAMAAEYDSQRAGLSFALPASRCGAAAKGKGRAPEALDDPPSLTVVPAAEPVPASSTRGPR